ncbi:MAG: WbqC family protein, partial [Holophagales bacterium]|nr:WbqC family protein [Holophagales bacterium]
FVFYDEVKYTKNDWRNRNRIYSDQGLQWLTVPVSPKAVRGTIRQVRLADSHWQRKHWNALRFTYGGAPFFHELEPLMREALLEHRWTSLVELDRFWIRRIAEGLGTVTELLDSADFELVEGKVDRLLGLLRQLGATEYISGPSARSYLSASEARFAEAGIGLTYKGYDDYPTYPQRREPFEHGVSIIDLLCHVGLARAPWYIWGHRDTPAPEV